MVRHFSFWQFFILKALVVSDKVLEGAISKRFSMVCKGDQAQPVEKIPLEIAIQW